MNIFDLTRQGDSTAIESILKSRPDLLENIDVESNSTVLATAVSFGHIDTVVMLLKLGANIETLGDDDWTLLHKACYQGHEDIAMLLIERGLNPSAKDANGWTPLHNACADGNISMTTRLLDSGSDKESPDNDGWTPLHLACDCSDDQDHCNVVKLLVERGISTERRDKSGETPLHRACTKGNENLVTTLLDLGANIKAEDNYGWSALHIAATNGHCILIKKLISLGADINAEDAKGWTPLLVAAAAGHTTSTAVLLEMSADVDHCAKDFTTPLYLACAKGHDAVVAQLIEAGSDLEAKVGNDELTALMIATGKSKISTTHLLIKKGANIEARDLNSLTVLHRATAKGLTNMVKILLDAGCDPAAKTQFGSTALDFAIDRKYEDLAALLKKAATKKEGSDVLPVAPRKLSGASTVVKLSAGEVKNPRPDGKKLIAEAAAEMGHRRRNRMGVRASMVGPALSDAEAAARIAASLNMENEEDGGMRLLAMEQMVKEIANSSSTPSQKNVQMNKLPPSVFSEVLRTVKQQETNNSDQGSQCDMKLEAKDLRRRSIAAAINFDVTRKEDYLTEAEFEQLFKMTKSSFDGLPKWKKEMKKKELGIF